MLISAFLLAAQMMVGKAGDPLMRPAIPDPFLIRQQWAQQELRLTTAEVKRLSDEIGRGMPTQQNPRMDPSKIKYDDTMALGKKYEKRIRQLSIWQADVLAFSNEWVQQQTGMRADQRKRVDGLCREFFKWWEDESEKLNKFNPRTADYSKPIHFSGPMRHPDEMLTLKKLVILRKELRRQIPPSQMAKLIALRGPAPHTAQPFGFPRSAPYVFVPYSPNVIMSPRVHEELGFTMRQSRLFLEAVNNSGRGPEVIARTYASLSASKRARLRQLELQAIGTRAILNHDVLDELRVDPDRLDDVYVRLTLLQRESMRVQNEEQQAYSALYATNGLDNSARMARHDKVRDYYRLKRDSIERQILDAILGLLDAAQHRSWKQMLGPPVPELAPRRP